MLTDRQNGGQNRDKAYFGSPVINTHSITPHWRRFPVAEKGLAGVWKSRNPESGNGTGIRNPEPGKLGSTETSSRYIIEDGVSSFISI